MSQYLPLLVMLALGVVFVAGSLVVSAVLAPHKRPTDAKLAPYECGIVPEIEPPQRFPVRFYLVAMIFVIFDIEVVFMYPFAVVFHQLGAFGLMEVLIFSATVFAALLFLVSEGALTWGPVAHLVRAMPARTTSSTIQRVSPESERVA
ncbi:MAG TPA: NADH-quinone oxidoreductase subunit A [Acidimicrobiales bacterium]|nr:NADH-quinone oxidoreductase subunit A [Acidimicrobiales bacterium]